MNIKMNWSKMKMNIKIEQNEMISHISAKTFKPRQIMDILNLKPGWKLIFKLGP